MNKKLFKVCIISIIFLFSICIISAENIEVGENNNEFIPSNENDVSNKLVSSEIKDYKIIVTYDDGKEDFYEIRGVCYSREENGLQNYKDHYENDLIKLKAINANTVRTYRPLAVYESNGQINYEETKILLDRFAEEGITVVVGFDLNKDIRTGLYKEYITHFSNHPAILMWSFGNEYNYHYHEWISESDWMDTLNEATSVAKQLSPNRITSVVHGEIPSDAQFAKYNNIKNLDLIMLNIYRGQSFGDLFTKWGSSTNDFKQPLIISEFGRSSQSQSGEDTSSLQSETLKSLWLEVKSNQDYVSAGGFIFELNDESWKEESTNNQIGSEKHLGLFLDQFTNLKNDAKLAAKTISDLWGGNLSDDTKNISTTLTITVDDVYYGENVLILINLYCDNDNLIDGLVKITVINDYILNIKNGRGLLNLSGMNAGNYNIIANFEGISKYSPSSTSANFSIRKINPKFLIDDIAFSNNESLVINTNLEITGNLAIVLNGINYNIPILNGKARINNLNLAIGNYSLFLSYDGDNNFNKLSENFDFSVKNNISLIGEDISLYYRNGTKYIVTLLDNENKPLTGKNLSITLNGVTFNRITDNKGKISVNINLDPGSYIAKVKFLGDNNFAPTEISNSINVKSLIDGDDIVKYFRNGTQYYATIYNGDGSVLANCDVLMNINGVMYTRSTDSKGEVMLSINLNPGNYIITTYHPDNGQSWSNNIAVLSTINSNDIVKYFRNGTQYYATLFNGDGSVLANCDVLMNINGVMYTRSTDSNGEVMLSINLNSGNYIITIYHPDNNQRWSNNIKVLPILIGNDISMNDNNRKTYDVKVLDDLGNVLKGVNVEININGIMYYRLSDDNGVARLNINLDPGSYIATAKWNEYLMSNKITIIN
ncbi:glycoside hydrolase family 2 TIM barrel-domain containing protein [Methanobrevibacter sp. DSM 116169]|uniref:glycoside hydrolase family 2 TIM barrel-domain containing protein n=1 Tax=Methanobrevibacter sp. DSM 116169 TaxID=3242727 RepID=UPI0038FC1325